MIRFLDLNAQYISIKSEIDQAIAEVISKSAFIGGHFLAKFEDEFAAYTNAENCVGVGNGTDALEIAIESLEMPPGSEIIVPANSFIASSEAVTRQGHKVVFADVDADSYVISVESVREKITSRTRAIMAVHLYGHPCDMGALLDLAKKHALFVIEDCAQAHGAEFMGQKVGSLGDIGTFSFYPGKNLGAYGDGGAITTNNEGLAERARMIANHGRLEKYNHEFEGRNSRLDGLQAAILSVKLKYLDSWNSHRKTIAGYYLRELESVGIITLPKRQPWANQVYHLFVVRTVERNRLKTYLSQNSVQTGIHYPISLPKLKAYEYLGQAGENFVANELDEQVLSLPIGEHLQTEDVQKVVRHVMEYAHKK